MTQHYQTLRPAMTAIAAVLALSSTASFAQVAENPAPVVETSPAPDPLSPEASTTTATPEPVASETTAAPAPAARPKAKASRPAARVTPARTSSVTRTRAATPVPVEAAPPAAPAPVDPLLVPPEMAAPAPVAAPVEPIPEAAPAAIDQAAIEEALPYAGAAGLGLLMLAGTGIAMRRRRRRREDAIEDAKWQHIVAQPEGAFESDPTPAPAAAIAPAPTFVRTPKPVAAAPATGASQVPDGFDTSRFGPNVQAAYAGPSPENPSASLKRRITVGHFLDQKAAAAAEAAPAQPAQLQAGQVQQKPAPVPTNAAAKPAFVRSDGDFMFRRDHNQPRVKPAYQK
jgi:hypothetical protein